MSSDSLAIFRKSLGDDFGALAEEHYRHDLNETDRAALQSAAKKLSMYATVGSLAGLGLGLFAAFRVRGKRTAMFNAFKATEKPTEVRFADGRSQPIPDLTNVIEPSALGDVAAYALFAVGGLFFGGELGLVSGGYVARRSISHDPQSRARIETAFRNFRADTLRAEAALLEKGQGSVGF